MSLGAATAPNALSHQGNASAARVSERHGIRAAALPPLRGHHGAEPPGRVWIGRRHDAPGEPEGPAPGGRCRRAASTRTKILPRPPCASSTRKPAFAPWRSSRRAAGWYSYDLPPGLRPKAWGGRYRGQKQKWFAMRFTGRDDEVVLDRPGHKPEFDAWRWADIDELPGLIVPFKREVYSQVVREFAALAKPQG